MAAARYASGADLVEIRSLERATARASHSAADRAEMERTWLAVLQRAVGPEAVRLACGQLALCGGEEALPSLAVMLGRVDGAPFVPMALCGIPGDGPLHVLSGALPVVTPAQRGQLLNSMGRRSSTAAAGAVAPWCAHADETVAVGALRALGRLGGSDYAYVLVDAQRDERVAVRTEAAAALLNIAQRELAAGHRIRAQQLLGRLPATSPLHIRRGAFELLLQSDSDGGAERALRLLSARSPDPILAPVAVSALPRFAGRTTAERFAGLWTNLPPELHAALADALARRVLERDDRRAHRALVRAMWWEPAPLREAAILALGRCGGPKEVGPLWERWVSGGGVEQNAAVRALVALPDHAAIDRQIVFRFNTAVATQRVVLMEILARRGGEAVRKLLPATTRDSDSAVARIAFAAAGSIGDYEDLPALLDSLKLALVRSEVRPGAEAALGRVVNRLGPRAGTELRSRWHPAEDPEWKAALLTLMARAGERPCLDMVVGALTDSSDVVRSAAMRALASWPSADAWHPLAQALKSSENPAERAMLFAGLVRLGRATGQEAPPVPARVRELWNASRNDDERRQVLGLAGEAPSAQALEIALEATALPSVRAEARIAAEKIAAAVASTDPDLAARARARLAAENQ